MEEANQVIFQLQGSMHHALPSDEESQADVEVQKKAKGAQCVFYFNTPNMIFADEIDLLFLFSPFFLPMYGNGSRT